MSTKDEASEIEPSIDTEMEPGDWARDLKSDDNDGLLLIVDVPDDVASTYVIYEEPNGTKCTVASHHSNRGEYDPKARVAIGVYKSGIDRRLVDEDREPNWTAADLISWYEADQLDEYRLMAYPFPVDRLEEVEV